MEHNVAKSQVSEVDTLIIAVGKQNLSIFRRCFLLKQEAVRKI